MITLLPNHSKNLESNNSRAFPQKPRLIKSTNTHTHTHTHIQLDRVTRGSSSSMRPRDKSSRSPRSNRKNPYHPSLSLSTRKPLERYTLQDHLYPEKPHIHTTARARACPRLLFPTSDQQTPRRKKKKKNARAQSKFDQ